MTRNSKTKDLVLMGIMTAIIFVMGLTPIGYIKTGTLSIALITIPVSIAAYALGPKGGTVAGLFFGITSAIMAFTAPSALMVKLMDISPAKVVILCVVPRVLVGLCSGTISHFLRKGTIPSAPAGTISAPSPDEIQPRKSRIPSAVSGGITGFSVAFLNTVFFMSSLLFLFGNSDVVQGMKHHENLVLFIIAVVTINVIIEWVSCTVITSGVAAALKSARLIDTPKKAEA